MLKGKSCYAWQAMKFMLDTKALEEKMESKMDSNPYLTYGYCFGLDRNNLNSSDCDSLEEAKQEAVELATEDLSSTPFDEVTPDDEIAGIVIDFSDFAETHKITKYVAYFGSTSVCIDENFDTTVDATYIKTFCDEVLDDFEDESGKVRQLLYLYCREYDLSYPYDDDPDSISFDSFDDIGLEIEDSLI